MTIRFWTKDREGLRRLNRILLCGLLAEVFLTNYIFLKMKSAPRGLDELDVWSGTVIFYARGYGLFGLWTAQPHDFVNFPPLLPWLAWVSTGLFGRTYMPMALCVTFLQIVLLLIVFSIGRRLAGQWAGLLAAAVLATSPVIMSFSRIFITNIPAVVTIGLVIWVMIWGVRLTRPGSGFLLGLALGVAFLSERGTPPLMLSLPLAYWIALSIWSVRKRKQELKKVLIRIGVAALVSVAFSGLYLYSYFTRSTDHIIELAANDVYPHVDHFLESLPEPLFYFGALASHQMWFLWALPLLIAVPFFFRKFNGEKGLLLCMAVWPMIVMLPFATKTFNYDLGKFVGVPIVLAVGLSSIPWNILRRIMLGLSCIVTLFSFWILQPDLLPQPAWPYSVSKWIGRLAVFDIRALDTPVFEDAMYDRLSKRVPQGPQYVFVTHAPSRERVYTLFCELGDFARLHFEGSEQVIVVDEGLPEHGEVSVDIWELTRDQWETFRDEYVMRSCPYITDDPSLLPDPEGACRPVYADLLDGQEFVWRTCNTGGSR